MWVGALVLVCATLASPRKDRLQHNVEDVSAAILENVDTAARGNSSAAPEPPTMVSEDVNLIRGAIQKILGGVEYDYVARTSPMRSPAPPASLPSAASLPSSAPLTPLPERAPYQRLLGQLADYAQKVERMKIPTRAQIGVNVPMLENVDPAARGNTSAAPKPHTMVPEDANLIRGAIQKLLGGAEDDNYIAPTGPPRSPAPLTPLPRDTPDSPIEGYHRLLGRLVDYAQRMKQSKIPSLAPIARMPSVMAPPGYERPPARGSSPGHEKPPARARSPGQRPSRSPGQRWNRRTRPTTTPTTTTTTPTTKNTLCTDSDEYCRTMCFDEDNYRVTCNTTTVHTTTMIDMGRLMAMLAGLIAEYDTNLTDVFNKTLKEKGYITCPHIRSRRRRTTTTVTTLEPTPALYDYEESNKTGAIIAKCYVCGLTVSGIPEDTHCGDAFAGEFLPLTPVDASARGKLASYRKYCKYMDMLPWYVNGSDGRSIWGKWTGGCSVRWIDLSNLYTQRACRSRDHPITGVHFCSKRMAKLEKALMRVDNGCIASPMSSLVPFSRGVSLFARFHACVCTGHFCNKATRLQHHTGQTILAVQALILVGWVL